MHLLGQKLTATSWPVGQEQQTANGERLTATATATATGTATVMAMFGLTFGWIACLDCVLQAKWQGKPSSLAKDT